MMDRALVALGRLCVRRAWWIIAGGLLLTVAALGLLPGLKVLTSRSALYPPELEVNRRFADFLTEFGTTSNLIAVIEGEPGRLGPFADDLAAVLRSERDVVRDVFHKADVGFFRDRAFLYLPLEQMEKLRMRVAENRDGIGRIGRYNGLLPLLDGVSGIDLSGAAQQQVDIDSARQIVTAGKGLFAELLAWLEQPDRREMGLLQTIFIEELSGRKGYDPGGYLRSRDGGMLFLFIQPVHTSEEFTVVHPLLERCRAAGQAVADRWRARGVEPPKVGFTGIPANADEEVIAIRHDTSMTSFVSAVLILAIVLLGFRSLRRGLLVFVPLVVAGVWNLGLTVLTVGHLTILTAGFTAVLFGMGVDYGIFLSGRVEEELRRGISRADAVVTAVRTSGLTLITAGGTTALAFFTIGTVEFTGFAELGIVAGTGALLVMLAMLVVLPALMAVVPLRVRPARAAEGAASRPWRPSRPAVVLVSLMALAATTVSVCAGLRVPLDFDLNSIMPTGSESVRLQQDMGRRSDFTPEFVAVIARDLAEAHSLTERLQALPEVARIESVTALLPADQERKIAIIHEVSPVFDAVLVPRGDFVPYTGPELADRIDALTEPLASAQELAFSAGHKQIVAGIEQILDLAAKSSARLRTEPGAAARARAFEQELFAALAGGIDQVRRWASIGPVTPDDLPRGLLDRFRGQSGRYALFVYPKGSIYDVEFLDRFLDKVYAIAPGATGFPTTHQVFSRMVIEGFMQASAMAVAVVLIVLLIHFRRPGRALLAALPLLVGAAWMFGSMRLFGWSHNYANIIALPLVLGLALDYGVYTTHRLAENRGIHPFETMRRAWLPVTLAALTTVAGVGALTLGSHQGAASLGRLLVVGIATCLVAALVVLPAVAALAYRPGPADGGTGKSGQDGGGGAA